MTGPAAAPHRVPAPVRRATRWATALSVVVFALVLGGGSPRTLFDRGPFSSDFFDAQAHALLDGHLDVDPGVAGIEGFEHDGRTHLYFGLVPALLRVPVAAVTDALDGRLTQVSTLVGLAVALWAAGRLVWRARRWTRGDGPPSGHEPLACGLFVAVVGLASPLLFLASRPVVYHEVEMWGTATALVTIEAVLHWWEQPGGRRLALAAASAVVALNTRASVGGGAVAALVAVTGLALLVGRVSWRRLPALTLAAALPVVAYGAVNQARFGHPFSVPFASQGITAVDEGRQATLESTGGSLFGAEFAPTALVTYLRPDGVRLQGLFPWVTFRESTAVIGDPVFDVIDRSASLPVVAPSLLLLALAGVLALARRGWRQPWWAATAATAAGIVPTVSIAFIAHRYLSDFTPLLVLPAAVGVWEVAAVAASRRRLVGGGLGALSIAGTVVSLALAVQAQRLFILPSDASRHDFVELQLDVHHALGGERPPDTRLVGGVADLGQPRRRGALAVAGPCDGLFWSDGERWWPLELGGDDGLALVLPSPLGAGTVLLDGPGWKVVAENAGTGEVVLAYRADDGRRQSGPPFERSVLEGATLDVSLDRANGEVTIRRGSTDVLVVWYVDLTGPVGPGPGLSAASRPTPLCDDVRGRLRVGERSP